MRSHANGTAARIEVSSADLARATSSAAIDAAVRAADFTFCSLDLGDFTSGRLNVLIGY